MGLVFLAICGVDKSESERIDFARGALRAWAIRRSVCDVYGVVVLCLGGGGLKGLKGAWVSVCVCVSV